MSAKDEKKLERLSKETGLSKSSLITLWINEQKKA